MTSQIIICMAIFAVTLISYMLNKIPMWVTAMLSMAALYITGCIDDAGALSGFANNNTILMATMFMVAAGFRRTSLVETMCNGLLRLTKGSFQKAYVGYLLLGALLTNFISSPMVVYAIVSPLMAALCDKVGQSRSKYMFPLMIVCVSCCGILPLPSAIQQAGQFTGFMETYGFTGMTFQPIYFFLGAWPVLLIVVALSLGLLISCVVRNQVAAMIVSGIGLMMPVMLLSGMIFPVESMPVVLQWISDIIPARWYIQAVRKVMIEGLGLVAVWREALILAGMAALLIGLSLKSFKERLE